MNQTDDRILELLSDSGLALSPASVAVNLDYSRNWISRRMSKLQDENLIEKVNGSHYQITARGEAYLAGEIAVEELEHQE